MFQHITEFLSIVNSGEQCDPPKGFLCLNIIILNFFQGLGYYSEQPFEAMHHDAKVLWERVKVGTGHPDVERALKDFVVSYNSKHI